MVSHTKLCGYNYYLLAAQKKKICQRRHLDEYRLMFDSLPAEILK